MWCLFLSEWHCTCHCQHRGLFFGRQKCKLHFAQYMFVSAEHPGTEHRLLCGCLLPFTYWKSGVWPCDGSRLSPFALMERVFLAGDTSPASSVFVEETTETPGDRAARSGFRRTSTELIGEFGFPSRIGLM